MKSFTQSQHLCVRPRIVMGPKEKRNSKLLNFTLLCVYLPYSILAFVCSAERMENTSLVNVQALRQPFLWMTVFLLDFEYAEENVTYWAYVARNMQVHGK